MSSSKGRVLLPEQSRRLLEAHSRILETALSAEGFEPAVAIIADIVQTKTALVGREGGEWLVLAQAGRGSSVPALSGDLRVLLDRLADDSVVELERWTSDSDEWTVIGLTRRTGWPAGLLLQGDWRPSRSSLQQLGHHLSLALWAYENAVSAQVRLTIHRLSRALARATTVRGISEAAVRAAAQSVKAQVVALAVATADGQTLSIAATHGYPLTLVEHLRIRKGEGVLGAVFERGKPVRVDDVALLQGARRRRPRYKTNSFAVVPIKAGGDMLGALCVTDRADGGPFTKEDQSTLRTIAATIALALVRERAQAQATSYAQAAAIDPVSGLFNRRYLQARLEEELQRAQRHALPVGLLMIDVDDFKLINDRFGHLAGDTVIGDIGEILRRSVRVFDVCTRFGGEEFAVVMPGSGPQDAARIAERIREHIESYHPSAPELSALRITASLGLAVSLAETSARDLISVADQALYQAKRGGKNQVRVGEVSPPSSAASVS